MSQIHRRRKKQGIKSRDNSFKHSSKELSLKCLVKLTGENPLQLVLTENFSTECCYECFQRGGVIVKLGT